MVKYTERLMYCTIKIRKNKNPISLKKLIIIFPNLAPWDTKKISGDQVFRIFYIIQVGALLEPETQIRGVVVILDFEGLGMKQVAQLTPSFSLRLLSFIQVKC